MAKKRRAHDEEAWANAQKLCRLTARQVEMGRGTILWDFDTAQEFTTVNGTKARGGSIDVGGPAIVSGMVLTTSGYAQWGGLPGNVLLAFSVDGRDRQRQKHVGRGSSSLL